MSTRRFEIHFDSGYAILSRALLLSPSASYLEIDDGDEVHARMAWAFRTTFPRAAVTHVSEYTGSLLSRGVHGFAGRWLVNGSGRGLVAIDLDPEQRARVMGFAVRLRQLMVSVEDPGSLVRALSR